MAGPKGPMNVEQIVAEAAKFDYDPHVPLKYWLRSARTLVKEAAIYEHEGNDQQTYLLLYRHAQLVVQHLSQSPESRHASHKIALHQAQRDVQQNLQRLEVLKPRINARHERYQQLIRHREARRVAAPARPDHRRQSVSSPGRDDGGPHMVAGENKDLAVELAHQEINRRAVARKATRKAGISHDVEHARRTAGEWDNWEQALSLQPSSGSPRQYPALAQPAAPPPPPVKAPDFAFKPSAFLENGSPLRTLFLPPDLRMRFLAIAEPNTRQNLETCGILCGTLISNALFISKLIIPEQESTSDTCETVNEGVLFDYVDGEDLMVLGWIHTHPTQTCFMSSRDLHTHGGYQVMMPESIAIVCAPSKGDWGVFRLTDPPGLRTILNCTQTGLFHPHSEGRIYTDASRPGHVHEAKGLQFDVFDMR